MCVCGRQVERDSGFKTPRQTCCWTPGSPRDATWNRLPPQSPTSPPPCAVMRWSVSHPRRAPWPRASPRDTIFFSEAFLCARHPVSTLDARLGGIHTTNGLRHMHDARLAALVVLGGPWRCCLLRHRIKLIPCPCLSWCSLPTGRVRPSTVRPRKPELSPSSRPSIRLIRWILVSRWIICCARAEEEDGTEYSTGGSSAALPCEPASGAWNLQPRLSLPSTPLDAPRLRVAGPGLGLPTLIAPGRR